ncbi:MAG: hypothetical protein Q4D98_12630 [Planctomycetia bacterium]|nr:hypothetical protein [Planctomycetia bacterium]
MKRRSFLATLLLAGTGCRSFSLQYISKTEDDFQNVLQIPEDSEVESLHLVLKQPPDEDRNQYQITESENLTQAMAALRDMKDVTIRPWSRSSRWASESLWPMEIRWDLKKNVPSEKYEIHSIWLDWPSQFPASPIMRGCLFLLPDSTLAQEGFPWVRNHRMLFTLPFETGRQVVERLEKQI